MPLTLYLLRLRDLATPGESISAGAAGFEKLLVVAYFGGGCGLLALEDMVAIETVCAWFARNSLQAFYPFLFGPLALYLLRPQRVSGLAALRRDKRRRSYWSLPYQTRLRLSRYQQARRIASGFYSGGPVSRLVPGLAKVLLGAIVVGVLVPGLILWHLLEIKAFGSGETRLVVCLVFATIGALLVAIHQGYSTNLSSGLAFGVFVWLCWPIFFLNYSLGTDWAEMRTWGWIAGLVVLVGLIALVCFERFGRFGKRACGIVIAIVLLFFSPLPLVICAAIFVGQIGQWWGGQLGLEFGETFGGVGVPAILLLLLIALHRPQGRDKHSPVPFDASDLIILCVVVVLADGAVLWLRLTDGVQGVEVRQVATSSGLEVAFEEAAADIALYSQEPYLVSLDLPRWLFGEAELRKIAERDGLPVGRFSSNATRYRELERLGLPMDRIMSATYARDGQQVLSAGEDGSVRLWDVATGQGQEKCRCDGHRNKVFSVGFSPDGRRAVSGSVDRTVRVWDLASGRQVCVCRGHTDLVDRVAFSADASMVLSHSVDGTVRVWQMPE